MNCVRAIYKLQTIKKRRIICIHMNCIRSVFVCILKTIQNFQNMYSNMNYVANRHGLYYCQRFCMYKIHTKINDKLCLNT